MAIDTLHVDFLGARLINPFIIASGSPSKDYETIKKAFQAGWAGAVTKSIPPSPLRDKTPRIGHVLQNGRVVMSQNYEMQSEYTVEQWGTWVKRLREEYPDRILYVSIFAGSGPDEWKRLSGAFAGTKANGLELNFSCPHSDHNGRGSIIGQNPDLCASLVQAVKKETGNSLKLMPKLPYLSHPNEGVIAKMCVEAGADAVCAINSIAGLSEIDAQTLIPRLNTGGKTTAGGISYEAIRPFGRLVVSGIARALDWKKYPISAVGGVSRDAQSTIEYIALGANHVQVCTEVILHGFSVLGDMHRNLRHQLEQMEKSLDDIRGAALPSVVSWDKLDDIERVAEINPELCKTCYTCVPACMYDAIQKKDGKPVITSACVGCGSCWSACPNGVIRMKPKKT